MTVKVDRLISNLPSKAASGFFIVFDLRPRFLERRNLQNHRKVFLLPFNKLAAVVLRNQIFFFLNENLPLISFELEAGRHWIRQSRQDHHLRTRFQI